jgi:hypothetical protein
MQFYFLELLDIDSLDKEDRDYYRNALDGILNEMYDCYSELQLLFDFDERVVQIGEELDMEEKRINMLQQDLTLAMDEDKVEQTITSEALEPPVYEIAETSGKQHEFETEPFQEVSQWSPQRTHTEAPRSTGTHTVAPPGNSSLGRDIKVVADHSSDLDEDWVSREKLTVKKLFLTDVEQKTASENDLKQNDGHKQIMIDVGHSTGMDAMQHMFELEFDLPREKKGKIVGMEFPPELKFFLVQHDPKPGG